MRCYKIEQEIEQVKEQTKKEDEQAIFSLKSSYSEDLKTFFNLADMISEELTIEIDQESIRFRCMDPSHVCLLDVIFRNESFEKYEVTKAGIFAIRSDEISKLVKTFNKKESLELSVTDDNLIKLRTKTSTNTLRLIEHTKIDTPLPKINFNAIIAIELKELKNILKRIGVISEYLNLDMHDQKLELSGRGDSGDSKVTLEKGMDFIPEYDLKENTKSTYSLEYVNLFFKIFNDGMITLAFSEKMPIKISKKINNGSSVDFYLAPRIEN